MQEDEKLLPHVALGMGTISILPMRSTGTSYEAVPGGAVMSASDLARFGHLIATRGNWNGEQLLDPQWLRGHWGGERQRCLRGEQALHRDGRRHHTGHRPSLLRGQGELPSGRAVLGPGKGRLNGLDEASAGPRCARGSGHFTHPVGTRPSGIEVLSALRKTRSPDSEGTLPGGPRTPSTPGTWRPLSTVRPSVCTRSS